eukprot:c7379_g1_i1.p1 GENE.c7379_g1_i1~~c7379_g1_i1.p1  ORF type:complete len:205 (-),score=50.42 c7379_g1_i1:40-654(-)
MNDILNDSNLRDDALRLLNNAAGNFATHSTLLEQAPSIVNLFDDVSPTVKGCIVTFVNVLAYNGECRATLLDAGVLRLLITSIQSHDPLLWPTDAAIAIANLVDRDHPAMHEVRDNHVIELLTDALDSTIRDEPFPAGSHEFYTDWKLMMGISKLAANVQNREILKHHKIHRTIKRALSRIRNRNTTYYALKTIWYLDENIPND